MENENLRLDLYLLLQYSDLSRNFISNSIKKGYVKVNNVSIIKSSYKVKSDDVIIFEKEDALKFNNEEDFENVVPTNIPLNIIFEDQDILVLNKPSGMATHPSAGHLEDTILNGVHFYLHRKEAAKLSLRKHMVHRLDKDTSGLIVFAKTDKMLWWMHKQFAERQVKKKYFALGLTPQIYRVGENIEIDGYIERSRRDSRLYLYSAKYGRWSSTSFIVEENYIASLGNILHKSSLVSCYPKTGRTHQIRVHLKHLNMPIWGDKLYSSQKQLEYCDAYSKKNNLNFRMFLQAASLDFKSYDGKEYKFNIELDHDLNKLLNTFVIK